MGSLAPRTGGSCCCAGRGAAGAVGAGGAAGAEGAAGWGGPSGSCWETETGLAGSHTPLQRRDSNQCVRKCYLKLCLELILVS